jgi:hypothetical protein
MGTLTGSVSNASIVAVPEGTQDIQHITTSRPDGGFSLTQLPSGDYRVFAIESAQRSQLNLPGVLERILSGAKKVTVASGTQTIEIRLSDLH